jgi:hypothetical protein
LQRTAPPCSNYPSFAPPRKRSTVGWIALLTQPHLPSKAHAKSDRKLELNPNATQWIPERETQATPNNVQHDKPEQRDTVFGAADYDIHDTGAGVEKRDTVNNGKQFMHDHNNLDNIFDVNNDESDDKYDPFVIIGNPCPNRRAHPIATLPMQHDQCHDNCLDVSAFCTQNSHGLWRRATDSKDNYLCNYPCDTTRFEHLISTMKMKNLDVYFILDTWLEDDAFDVDVGGYHVFRHNGPSETTSITE